MKPQHRISNQIEVVKCDKNRMELRITMDFICSFVIAMENVILFKSEDGNVDKHDSGIVNKIRSY